MSKTVLRTTQNCIYLTYIGEKYIQGKNTKGIYEKIFKQHIKMTFIKFNENG